MDFKKLKNVIDKDLKVKIEGSNGLAVFSKESSKFEKLASGGTCRCHRKRDL